MTTRVGGGTAVAASTGRRPASEPAHFETGKTLPVPIKEASDVVALPGDRFLVASDTADNLALVDADGTATKVHLEGIHGASEIEGLAYDPVRRNLFVAREESRELLRYDWNPDKRKHNPELKRRLELDLGEHTNKGVEGLSYLPGELSPTGMPQLLAVNEGKPRELLVMGDGGAKNRRKVALDPKLTEALADFSAVTVDPKTGDVFIGSAESAKVAQLRLEMRGGAISARLVQVFSPRGEDGKPLARIEGLAFDAKGNLFVLTENDGALHRLNRR